MMIKLIRAFNLYFIVILSREFIKYIGIPIPMYIVILIARQPYASLNKDFEEHSGELQYYYPFFTYLQINIK